MVAVHWLFALYPERVSPGLPQPVTSRLLSLVGAIVCSQQALGTVIPGSCPCGFRPA